MSDKKWYENLSCKELCGRHVHVTFSIGSMDGCLNLRGQIPYWADDDDMKYVQILERDKNGTWSPVVGVESVDMIWDERDWEQISVKDLDGSPTGSNYAVVVNGNLHIVRWYRDSDCCFDLDDASSVNMDDLTFGLRRRGLFTAGPGFYRDDDNTLLLKIEDCWSLIRSDFKALYPLTEGEVNCHLPLTPLTFIDRKTDKESL